MPRKKILLVEDDKDVQVVVMDLLEQEGYRTITATDVKSAMAALEHEKPSLVLLDLILPDGDGFDICRHATEGTAGNDPIPVIILSGKANLDCKLKSFVNGARRYFTKPFDVEELVEAIRSILLTRSPQSSLV